MISYLITDPKYYTSDIEVFTSVLVNAVEKHKVDFACFRDKNSTNFSTLAKAFVAICNNYNIKSIINTDYVLANSIGAYGVHLPSKNIDDIQKAKQLGLFVVYSTHSSDEIQKAISLQVDMITYSPIFDTPQKGTPKGINDLNNVCEIYNAKIIALGGIITKKHIEKIKSSKAKGFASIRYFVEY